MVRTHWSENSLVRIPGFGKLNIRIFGCPGTRPTLLNGNLAIVLYGQYILEISIPRFFNFSSEVGYFLLFW